MIWHITYSIDICITLCILRSSCSRVLAVTALMICELKVVIDVSFRKLVFAYLRAHTV